MRKLLLWLAAGACLLLGALTLPLPLPTGLLLIAVGLVLGLMASPSRRRWLYRLRRRRPDLDEKLRSIEGILPAAARRVLGGGRLRRRATGPGSPDGAPKP